MPLSTQPYKGARDFYPEDKRLQKYLFSTMRNVVESFGYEEYDAPILEPIELYIAKSGSELVNEQTYTFEDRGGRRVVIRPEMTPTVSRLVAGRRQELAYPLRWYSIPNLWRYERPQHGRLREHWQLNVDIFGVESLNAEHELITVASSILSAFGATAEMYVVKINSRVLMNYLLTDYLGLDATQTLSLMKLIDRMHKTDASVFKEQVNDVITHGTNHGKDYEALTTKVISLLKSKSLADLPEEAQKHESVNELKSLFSMLESAGIKNTEYDITVMRGFDYYTDVVFEVFDTDPENNRSMFGGGRYDGLVGLFGAEPIPTVGFGMGDVTLKDFLSTHGLLPDIKTETDVAVILVGDVYADAQPAIKVLRDAGLKVAVDSSGSKLDKQLKSASKKGVGFALFIGEQELSSGKYKLREMASSDEKSHTLEDIVEIVKKSR